MEDITQVISIKFDQYDRELDVKLSKLSNSWWRAFSHLDEHALATQDKQRLAEDSTRLSVAFLPKFRLHTALVLLVHDLDELSSAANRYLVSFRVFRLL